MTVHYPLSPSASERWLNCPGSVSWTPREGDDRASSYAEEGTAAHELLAARLRDPGDNRLPRCCMKCGRWASRSTQLDPACPSCGSSSFRHDAEMFQFVSSVEEQIYRIREDHIIIREHIEHTWVDSEIPNFGGTADYVAVYWWNGLAVVHVVDFKYGAGVPVAAAHNTQLLCYLRLVRCTLPPHEYIMRGTIAQPRTPGSDWDTYEFPDQEYHDFISRLTDAAKPSGELVPGGWCRWCSRAKDCPALHQIALQSASIEFTDEPTPELVMKLLEMGPSLKAMIDAAPELALQLLERGVDLPGWKAVESIGNRTWIEEDTVVLKKLRGKGVGYKKSTVRKLKTPTQLDREGFGEHIKNLVHRPSRGYTVVRDTDRRPAIVFDQSMFPDDLKIEGE